MSTPAFNRLSPAERQRDIMSATREVLREVGFEKLKTPDVAQRCGVSEGLVYRYFPTKRDLLMRAAEGWFDELLVRAKPVVEQLDSTYDRLRYVVAYSLDVVRQEPALTRFILNEMRADPGYRSTQLFELNRRFTTVVTDVLARAVADGDFRDDVSVTLLRDMIFGAVEHQTWRFLRDEGDFPPEASADGITRVIYRGMASDNVRDSEGER